MSDIDFKTLSRQMADREGLGGSVILITIIALVFLILYWASWAELDNVTRGEGRIVSSVQNQLVQAAEGGVILRRYVTENTIVAEGDILFELDPVDASGELNRLLNRLAALEIKEMRLRAEIDDNDFLIEPTLAARSPIVALSEQSLFSARKAELSGQLTVLQQRLQQVRQDLETSRATVSVSARTIDLLENEILIVDPLVREKITPATRLLELQRELERFKGDKSIALIGVDRALTGIIEIETQIQNTSANYALKAMDELNSVVTEKSELKETLPMLTERLSRTVIHAPLDGIVNKVNFRTLGGYINKGDVIVELVPTGEALIISAQIKPKDISNIAPDDLVKIRFSAYDSAKYGVVAGRVIRISPDAVVDQNSGAVSHYLIDVSIEGDISIDGKSVTFIPGMTATVDVLSGKRTVLDYFWQPLARVNELALRD